VLRGRGDFCYSYFSLDIRKMAKSKLSRKLDKKEPTKKAPFEMAEPNDDIGAFGWSMDRLRYPSNDSKKGDVWPGRGVFDVDEAKELYEQYGFNVEFINAKFVQVMLDNSAAVRAAAEKCAAEKYSPESRANLRNVINKEFRDTIVPAMVARFKKVSALVADFYAARIAHLLTFGSDGD